jgi:fermentation-respiration switch protein FrsA (DUF1100 family)
MFGEQDLAPGRLKNRRIFTRELLIATIIALVFGCVALFYGLRWVESAITFHPVRMNPADRGALPRGAEEGWFNANDGTRLHGWFFESETDPAAATIIYFHGNGGNISNVDWVGQSFAKKGFDVLLFDYRGYGASDGRVGGESELYADGDAAVAFAIKVKGARPERVVLHGQSLGTAIVVDVASRQNFCCVILESGLSSASSVAESALPWLPTWLHFLGKNRFESAQKLARVKVPVLITHGDPDPVLPTEQARILFASANEPKKLLIFRGVGHNVFGSLGEEYLIQVEHFIRESLAQAAQPTARL